MLSVHQLAYSVVNQYSADSKSGRVVERASVTSLGYLGVFPSAGSALIDQRTLVSACQSTQLVLANSHGFFES